MNQSTTVIVAVVIIVIGVWFYRRQIKKVELTPPQYHYLYGDILYPVTTTGKTPFQLGRYYVTATIVGPSTNYGNNIALLSDQLNGKAVLQFPTPNVIPKGTIYDLLRVLPLQPGDNMRGYKVQAGIIKVSGM
jgi:hypothetical protein